MTLEDLKAVAEIERRSQLEPWSEDSIRSELERSCARILLARTGGNEVGDEGEAPAVETDPGQERVGATDKRVVGYICYWLLLDEVHILNVTVEAEHRGKGIGTALLSHALKQGWEAGARRAFLEVRESNAAALALYRRFGFTAVGRRPGYYGVVRESAVVMELSMNESWRRNLGDASACPYSPAEKILP